jgi:hypothetical protein
MDLSPFLPQKGTYCLMGFFNRQYIHPHGSVVFPEAAGQFRYLGNPQAQLPQIFRPGKDFPGCAGQDEFTPVHNQ